MKKLIYSIFTIFCLLPLTAQGGVLAALAPHDVYLYGEVNDESAAILAKQLHDADDGNEITLHIISPGGSVYAGLYIVDTMRGIKSPVRTVCESYCMSMGALILAAGDKREALPNATILTHTVAGRCEGHIQDEINCVNEHIRLQAIMDGIFMKATGRTIDEVRAMEAYDHFISAQDAVIYGLIDNIQQPAK